MTSDGASQPTLDQGPGQIDTVDLDARNNSAGICRVSDIKKFDLAIP